MRPAVRDSSPQAIARREHGAGRRSRHEPKLGGRHTSSGARGRSAPPPERSRATQGSGDHSGRSPPAPSAPGDKRSCPGRQQRHGHHSLGRRQGRWGQEAPGGGGSAAASAVGLTARRRDPSHNRGSGELITERATPRPEHGRSSQGMRRAPGSTGADPLSRATPADPRRGPGRRGGENTAPKGDALPEGCTVKAPAAIARTQPSKAPRQAEPEANCNQAETARSHADCRSRQGGVYCSKATQGEQCETAQ